MTSSFVPHLRQIKLFVWFQKKTSLDFAQRSVISIIPHFYRLVLPRRAYELPICAKYLAQTGKYHVILCLGILIKGETAHFEYIAGAVSKGSTPHHPWTMNRGSS